MQQSKNVTFSKEEIVDKRVGEARANAEIAQLITTARKYGASNKQIASDISVSIY